MLYDDLIDFLTKNPVFYLQCDISDFRQVYGGVVSLFGKSKFDFQLTDKNIKDFLGFIAFKESVIFCWDIKKFFSYLYFRQSRSHYININSKLVDIKYVESFLGIEGKAPITLEEACRRGKLVKDCWNVHKEIHLPLATYVIPKIETYGFTDNVLKSRRYSFYEIEGQQNGRLRCYQAFEGAVLAHNLSNEDKKRFNPNQDSIFAILDYKSMEVCVLQWLSKDERLGKIIASGRDIYSTIFSLLFNAKCDAVNRQFVKDTFLPIMYGLQPESLSQRQGITLDKAKELIDKVNEYFHVAMTWIKEKQGDKSVDYFGRTRDCSDKPWVARNAVVQGTASIVCLEKLIALKNRIKSEIVATIHDAYVLDVLKCNLYDEMFNASEELEKESKMAPGLKLKVEMKIGNSLDDMKLYKF